MPLTLYKTYAWQTLAFLRLFTCLFYPSTYCMSLATLRQNKPYRLLHLGYAEMINTPHENNHFPMFSWVVFIMSRIACWVECTLQNPYWDGERENERFHSREDQFFQDPIKVRQQRNRPIVVCVMVINLQNYKSQLRDRRDRSPTTEQHSHKLHHHHQSMHFYSTQYPNVTDSFF